MLIERQFQDKIGTTQIDSEYVLELLIKQHFGFICTGISVEVLTNSD